MVFESLELSDDNFILFATANYDNTYCLSKDEFIQDVNQLKVIQRTMSMFVNGRAMNIKLLVNNILIFYNCFDHHAATKMLQYKVKGINADYYNAILDMLSLPLLDPVDKINKELALILQQEYN